MPSCSTCEKNTEVIGGIPCNTCDHVVCSECARLVLSWSKSSVDKCVSTAQDDYVPKMVQCPANKLLSSDCNGLVDEDELALLIRMVENNFSAEPESQDEEESKTIKNNRNTGDTTKDSSISMTNRLESEHHNLLLEKLMKENGGSWHEAILYMDNLPMVENQKPINCRICLNENIEPGEGIVLKECGHFFCKDCISWHIYSADTADVKCPFVDTETQCTKYLQPPEVKALVSLEEYERHYFNLLIKDTEASVPKSFHCRKPDCLRFCVEEGFSQEFFQCPIFSSENCLKCKEIHSDRISCSDHKKHLERTLPEQVRHERKSEKIINGRLWTGEYQRCPNPGCGYPIEKNGGCGRMECVKCNRIFQWDEGLEHSGNWCTLV